ncbi:cysteine-rich KTR domain-containing protein [Listeria monocytogenes]|nr:cysteine-rich KTR domain-containing protein [Listeria monocytogenes]
MKISDWLFCPLCNSKTRLRVRSDTETITLPFIV